MPHTEHVRTVPYFYEYLNVMDGRKILDELLAIPHGTIPASVRTRLSLADTQLRSCLTPSPSCIWGIPQAEKHGYSPERHWYYYAIPAHAPTDWME